MEILMLAVWGLGLVFYFLPTVIAEVRKHHSNMAILLINLFFGWTMLGWLAALIWALNADVMSREEIQKAREDAVKIRTEQKKNRKRENLIIVFAVALVVGAIFITWIFELY